MAQDISELVVKVTSDGIRQTASDLRALTKAANGSEEAVKKLGTSVATGEVAVRDSTATAKAFEEAMNRMAKATEQVASQVGKLADKQVQVKSATAQATAEVDKNTESSHKAAKGHGSNAAAIREVMVLTHELSQGSYKRFGGSLLVLVNQLDLVPKAMAAIKAQSLLMTLAWTGAILAGGGVILTLGAVLVALNQGAREQFKFNAALKETGNFAGSTSDGLHSMAVTASTVHGTIGEAKDAVLAFASSGHFANAEIGKLAETAVLMHEAFGKSIEDTVKEFEKLAQLAVTSSKRSTDAVSQHVMGLNDKYHFLTVAQFEHIQMLEKTGHAVQAAQEAERVFADEQSSRAKAALENLGNFAKMWHSIKAGISEAMDAMGEWGKQATPEIIVHRLQLKRDDVAKDPLVAAKAKVNILKSLDDEIENAQRGAMHASLVAAQEGWKQQKTQEDIHDRARLRSIFEQHDKEFKARNELKELDDRWASQSSDETYAKEHKREYERARADIIARGADKPVRGSDDSVARRDGELMAVKAHLQEQRMVHEEFQRNSKELAKKQGEDERTELARRDADRAQELVEINEAHTKELDIIKKFANEKHTAQALTQNKNRGVKVEKDFEMAKTAVENAGKDDARAVLSREMADREKLMKHIEAEGDADVERVDRLIKAEEKRVQQSLMSKSQVMLWEAKQADLEAQKLADEKARLQFNIDNAAQIGAFTDAEVDGMRLKQTYLDKRIAQQGVLAKLTRDAAAGQAVIEKQDRTTKNLDDALAAAKRFEKGMTSAFGNVGKAIGGIGVSFTQMMKDMDTAQVARNKAVREGMDASIADAELQQQSTTIALNGMANMTDAAKGFFDTKSRGYAMMEGISKAFHAAEAVRSAISLARSIAVGAAKMFEQLGVFAWPAIGAMAATMAAFGFSVATSKNGGGQSAADVQKAQGTGTVLGDIGTKKEDGSMVYKEKSDSIAKSLEYIKSNSSVILPVNQAMLQSLRNIEASMGGLTNLVARTPGMTNGTNMGIQEGTIARMGTSNSIAGGLGGAAALGAFGTAVGGIGTALLGAATFGIGLLAGVVVNKLVSLWGSTKQNIVDSGLQFGGNVSGLKNGSGVNQYASVDTTKSSWFGLSKSTTNRVETQGVGNELAQQFGLIFTNLEDTLKLAAPTLGKSADAVGQQIENMVITTEKISLKGLSGTELQNAINGVISKTMDEIAQNAFPQMDAFRQVGEGYAQTVIRVATGVEKAKGALEQLGVAAIDYTAVSNKQGDVAAEMIRQSLLLSETTKKTVSFQLGTWWGVSHAFTTTTESLSGVGEILRTLDGSADDLVNAYSALMAIRKQMLGVGLNGAGLNVNVLKGAGGLTQLGNALTKYQDKYFTDAQKAAIMTKDLSTEFSKLGLTLPATKAVMQQMIETASRVGGPDGDKMVGQLLVLSGAYADAIEQTNTANKNATDKLSSTLDALKKFSDGIKSFKDSLVLGALSTLTPIEKLTEAKRQYESTVAKAMSGDQTARDNVTNYAQAYLEASKVVNASDDKYTASFSQVQSDMDKMAALADSQITDAQAQLNALQTQIDMLTVLNTTADSINVGISNIVAALPTIAPTAPASANNDAVVEELAKLRAEAAAQAEATAKQINDLTAATYDSQAKAANTIVDGTTDAMKRGANRKFGLEEMER